MIKLELKRYTLLLLCALLLTAGWQPGVDAADGTVVTLEGIPDQLRGATVTLRGATTLKELNVRIVNSEARLIFVDTFAPQSDGSYSRAFTISATEALGLTTVAVGEGAIVATQTFRIVLPDAPGPVGPVSGEGGATVTPGTPEKPESPATEDSGVEIIVDGKSEAAAAPRMSTLDGRSVATVALDAGQLSGMLASTGQQPVVTLAIKSDSDIVVGELTGQMVSHMEQRQAVLVIRTGAAVYTLPAGQINIRDVSQQLGKSVALEDIVVRIEIAKPTAATMAMARDSVAAGGFELLAAPLEFTIKASYDGRTVDVSRFDSYVERTVALPEGIDASKVTTAVVNEPDGRVRHVPTQVTVDNGIYYAKINSLTNSVYSIIWNRVIFADMTSHWAEAAVNDMGSRLVVTGAGDGRFDPEKNVTRAEFAAMLARGLGLPIEASGAAFSDVEAGAWYSGVVHTAKAWGLIDGFEDGTFRPQAQITREQAMTMLSRAFVLTGLKHRLPEISSGDQLAIFTDSDQVAPWAVSAVTDTLLAGLVQGRSGDVLAPKATVTRAEVAVMVQRLLQTSELI